MNYAGGWRLLAFIIDQIILIIGAGIIGAVLGFVVAASNPTLSTRSLEIYGNILGFLLSWLYFAFLESSPWQATLGKKVLGIRVVDESGIRISFLRATGRFFGKIVSGLLLAIGYLMILFTRRKQGLHDIMASTLVVRGPALAPEQVF